MKKKDKKNNKSSLGEDDYKILVSPNEPLINYRGIGEKGKDKDKSSSKKYIKKLNVKSYKIKGNNVKSFEYIVLNLQSMSFLKY